LAQNPDPEDWKLFPERDEAFPAAADCKGFRTQREGWAENCKGVGKICKGVRMNREGARKNQEGMGRIAKVFGLSLKVWRTIAKVFEAIVKVWRLIAKV
jgi:hypothetical protein